MLIRLANPDDRNSIDTILRQAFPGPEEAALVQRLHDDDDVTISLVADIAGSVVGTVTLSPMTAPFRALGLAPVAVAPEQQRQGIAAALIHESIELARFQGWDAIFVLGDPQYYERFGFFAETASGFDNPYSGPYLMALALGEHGLPTSSGTVDYARAFASM